MLLVCDWIRCRESLELGAYLCHCGGVERWMEVDIEVYLE